MEAMDTVAIDHTGVDMDIHSADMEVTKFFILSF